MKFKILTLIIAAALSGCSLAPDYQRPATSEMYGWDGLAENQQETAALPDWRTFMADARLQELVDKALLNNKDLRQSVLNVQSMAATYRIQDSERYPAIDATGSATRQRTSAAYTGAGHSYSSQYSATVGFSSYELDLFGKMKSLSDEALETYFAEDELRRSAAISLISEVASTYMTLLAQQQLLELAEQTSKAYQETLALVNIRYNAGLSSALTLAQSKTALYGAQASLAQYKLSVAQQRNALRQLVGDVIAEQINGKLPEEEGTLLSQLAVGASSSLLQSRPDIIAAEHSLKAANANIGAARAAFFPSISLTANAGSMSSSLGNLFSADSGMWQFAPSISIPIFNWGSKQASLDQAKIKKELSVVQYQQTIETAFKEVSDALLGQQYYMEEWQAQQANFKANRQYYDLALLRYEKGNDSYMDLLDAQRSLFSARESELNAHLNLLVSRINLYKALGGGWQVADAQTAMANPADERDKPE